VLTNGTVSFRPQNPDIFYNTTLRFDDGANWNMFNGSGAIGTVFFGPVTLNGLVHIQVGDSSCTVSNVISGPGGFYWDNYNHTLTFTATNTYQGVTDIRAGRTLALGGNGSILNSSNILLATNATLLVTNRVDGTLTLTSGQTLSGNGIVDGNLTVGAGATVSPGSPIGVLSVTNGSITLSGTTFIEIDKTSGTNNQLSATSAAANITYGGTLVLTNISAPFATNDSFQIFNAATYSGVFSSIVPATPGAGLVWNTNQLATSGIIEVASVPPSVPPTIGKVVVTGGNVVITGTNNTGPGGTYHVLTSTMWPCRLPTGACSPMARLIAMAISHLPTPSVPALGGFTSCRFRNNEAEIMDERVFRAALRNRGPELPG
jgi:autotransporter-associated beta strand protein